MSSTLRIGRLAGIPIGIRPLWLLVVALITYSLGHDYYGVDDPALSSAAAYALGLLSALVLFAGIVLHELGHAIVARRRGVQVDEIDLWLLGGVARIHGEPRRPRDELAYALAGPAVTAVLLAAAGALRLGLGGGTAEWLRDFVDYGVYVNAVILVFNLVPAFPLDGGRVLHALLWMRHGNRDRATATAARSGRAFGYTLIALGLVLVLGAVPSGIWFAIVGAFLVVAATAEAEHAHVHDVFGTTTVAEVMSAPAFCLPGSTNLRAAAQAFDEHHVAAVPVIDEEGRALGVLTADEVDAVNPELRRAVAAGRVASREPELVVHRTLAVEKLFSTPALSRVGGVVVVDDADRPLGVVSDTDLQRRLRAGKAKT